MRSAGSSALVSLSLSRPLWSQALCRHGTKLWSWHRVPWWAVFGRKSWGEWQEMVAVELTVLLFFASKPWWIVGCLEHVGTWLQSFEKWRCSDVTLTLQAGLGRSQRVIRWLRLLESAQVAGGRRLSCCVGVARIIAMCTTGQGNLRVWRRVGIALDANSWVALACVVL